MIKIGEYKGKPVLSILKDENDKYPFTFGVSKAKKILENVEEITKFVEQQELGKKETKEV